MPEPIDTLVDEGGVYHDSADLTFIFAAPSPSLRDATA